jgi:phytoene synthase
MYINHYNSKGEQVEMICEFLYMRRCQMGHENYIWNEKTWADFERNTRNRVRWTSSESMVWDGLVRQARIILRTYSTSFFIVTRFLPPHKRAQVEMIYAAVRYPDEIVDTFEMDTEEKNRLLDQWLAAYELGLEQDSIRAALRHGLPSFIAGFTQVIRETGIPHAYYRSFIDAMGHDVSPGTFDTLDDLIENYIYGSATVVGYFLTYVYGARQDGEFNRALQCARNLAIALQLTNFLRDVAEDERRGRLYLPLDMLHAEQIDPNDVTASVYRRPLGRVLKHLGWITDDYYQQAFENVDAFAPDSQVAIRACIEVYRQLNSHLATDSEDHIFARASVSIREKLRVLPMSKYWRLPLAYLRT